MNLWIFKNILEDLFKHPNKNYNADFNYFDQIDNKDLQAREGLHFSTVLFLVFFIKFPKLQIFFKNQGRRGLLTVNNTDL